jgi:hypothetical protein
VALSDLKRARASQAKPNLVVDLSAFMPDGEEASITFREPTGADLFRAFQAPTVAEKVKYPDYDDELIKLLRLMAICYVATEGDEGKYNVFETLGDLARDNKLLYLYIHGTFNTNYQLDLSVISEKVPND